MARKRKKNPTPIQWGLIALGTAAVVGVGVNQARKRRDKKKKTIVTDDDVEHYLSGIMAPGATLGASPDVVRDLQFPIELGQIVIRTPDGEFVGVDGAAFDPGSDPGIGDVVTNLRGDAALQIYEISLAGLAQQKQPAEAATFALSRLRSKIDWQGLDPAAGSAEDMVLTGAVLLAVIGEQSLRNKGAL